MKKVILLFLGLVICISTASCKAEYQPAKESGSTSTQETNAEKTYGINESVTLDDLRFTANEIKVSEGDEFFTPQSGNVFIGVNFTVENISDEEQSVSSPLLFDAYADDAKCDYSFNAACAFYDGELDGSIAPGKRLAGWYAVEVPENWSKLELNVKSSWLASKTAVFAFNR